MGAAFKRLGFGWLLVWSLGAAAQRTYASHSVLRSGLWAKIAVRETGVYRLDMGVLKSLGLPPSIPSSQLQVWGRREAALPEANSTPRTDDLEQIAIQVQDGGDGVLNGSDYALFFAEGPDVWRYDSTQRQFQHQKNLYSERRYYFITIKEGGLRIPIQTTIPTATLSLTTFDEHCFTNWIRLIFCPAAK